MNAGRTPIDVDTFELLVTDVEANDVEYVVTRDGVPAAVLVSPSNLLDLRRRIGE